MRTLMSAWMRSIRCHTIADLPEVGVSVPLQNGISYPQPQQCSLRFTCPRAKLGAYHVPRMSHDRVRAFHFAGGLFDDVLRKSSGATNHATPDSSFGVSMLTTFIRSSDILLISVSLAPQPPCCWQYLV
jgi:hypothetical protein